VLPEQIGQGFKALLRSKVVLEHRGAGAHVVLVLLWGRLNFLDATDELISDVGCTKGLARAKLTSMQLHAGEGAVLRHRAARRKITAC
jgi:hypothetical protein